jgi:uncharacterized protein (DUF952 family)
MAFIIVLIDGVGLAPASASNLVATGMPTLTRALGQTLTNTLLLERPMLYAAPIDATLGVAGLPQSGSGHAAIWGGFNAAASNGRHQPSYPTIAMRERLKEHNLFSAARALGYEVAWANAYLSGYIEAVAGRRLRHTAGTWAALQAGLELRGVEEVQIGTALTWDITHHLARGRPGATMLPLITPSSAAERLAALARTHDVIAFETYLPDLAAHRRIGLPLAEALAIVDEFASSLITNHAAHDTVIMTSDHGNSEDSGTSTHTRNPVPLIVAGPAAAFFRQIQSIDQITPTLLEMLER